MLGSSEIGLQQAISKKVLDLNLVDRKYVIERKNLAKSDQVGSLMKIKSVNISHL